MALFVVMGTFAYIRNSKVSYTSNTSNRYYDLFNVRNCINYFENNLC